MKQTKVKPKFEVKVGVAMKVEVKVELKVKIQAKIKLKIKVKVNIKGKLSRKVKVEISIHPQSVAQAAKWCFDWENRQNLGHLASPLHQNALFQIFRMGNGEKTQHRLIDIVLQLDRSQSLFYFVPQDCDSHRHAGLSNSSGIFARQGGKITYSGM